MIDTKKNIAGKERQSIAFPFIVIAVLFFIWGFITALNDILIPYLKGIFTLSYFEASLVQFSFFGAYFLGSLFYFFWSIKYGDPIGKVGYKKCMLLGVVIATVASIMFYPAAKLESFSMFLSALFLMGTGFTLLQIAANPYVIILGSEKGASGRLNLAQGINSLGTTIAPAIGALILFAGSDVSVVGIDTVEWMYLVFAFLFVAIAILITLAKIPEFKSDKAVPKGADLLKYPHLIMGVVAIFMYVGGEVSVGSFMISFIKLPEIAGLAERDASKYVSMYWGGLMIGRFMGAVGMSTGIKSTYKYFLFFLILMVAFIIAWKVLGIYDAIHAGGLLLLNIIFFIMGGFLSARTLFIFALVVIGLLFFAVFSQGMNAVWALVGAGLFNSIMWSNIFSLSLRGLGKHASQGSSLLIMAILGAALVPALQGWAADRIGLQLSFLLPVLCYTYLCYYGLWSQNHLKKMI